MSKVTNIILITSGIDDSSFTTELLSKFIVNGEPFVIRAVDDPSLPTGWYGGNRVLECNIFIGAYTSFPLNEFISFITNVNWYLPENIQLLVKEDSDYKFRLFEIM
jgi:hypothetical protein